MRAAILIEDGITQVVLTPENEWERSSLKMIADKQKDVSTFWGAFYQCRGGWIRQTHALSSYDNQPNDEASLIFKIDEKKEQP